MKKLFALLVFCIYLFAESYAPATPLSKSKMRLGGGLNLGFDYYHYKEPNIMSISGPMFSVDGSFSFAYKYFKTQLDGYFSTHLGANRYDGGLFSPNSNIIIPYKTDSQDWYAGVASRFGASFLLKGREVVFVYAGFGYRYLHNMMIDKPSIKASYERDQGYVYFLAGIDGEIPINRIFSITASFQHRQLIYGHQVSGMSALGYDSDLYFTQSNGFGGRLSLGGKFYLYKQIALTTTLYFDYWAIEDSDIITGYKGGKAVGDFVEPHNTTKVVGLSIGVAF